MGPSDQLRWVRQPHGARLLRPQCTLLARRISRGRIAVRRRACHLRRFQARFSDGAGRNGSHYGWARASNPSRIGKRPQCSALPGLRLAKLRDQIQRAVERRHSSRRACSADRGIGWLLCGLFVEPHMAFRTLPGRRLQLPGGAIAFQRRHVTRGGKPQSVAFLFRVLRAESRPGREPRVWGANRESCGAEGLESGPRRVAASAFDSTFVHGRRVWSQHPLFVFFATLNLTWQLKPEKGAGWNLRDLSNSAPQKPRRKYRTRTTRKPFCAPSWIGGPSKRRYIPTGRSFTGNCWLAGKAQLPRGSKTYCRARRGSRCWAIRQFGSFGRLPVAGSLP